MMWRIVLIILLSCCGIEAMAQGDYVGLRRPTKRMEMGVSVGAAYMGLMASEADLKPKFGVRGALSMSLCWQEQFAMQLEVAYIYNKIDARVGEELYDVKSNVMEVPLLFSYRGLWPLRFNVGPVLSLGGTARYSNGEQRIEFGRLRSTLGYAAGMGVSLGDNILLDARFTSNFGRTDNYFEGKEFRSMAYWATLSIGYMF